MRVRFEVVLAVACLLGGGACHEQKRTEIVVGLATDLAAPTPLRQVNVRVTKLPDEIPLGMGTSYPISGALGTVYELPGTYGVYSDAGTADRVRVTLTAIDDQMKTLVVRTAVFSLVPEKTLFVRLGVISACQGKSDCPGGMTCIEGRCASEEVDSTRLPTYMPGIETTIECAGGTTFVDTSTMQPLLPVAAACASGVCAEGLCLAPPGAGGAGGSGAMGGMGGMGTAGGGGAGGRGTAGAGGAAGAMVVSRPANLKAMYQLNQTFSADEVGVPPLVPVDPLALSAFMPDTVDGVTRTVWAFAGAADPPSQAGLTLATPGLVNPQSYSVDMVVEFTAGAGAWRRLLDVQNRQSDDGFYVDPSDNLDIYRVSGSTAAFATSFYHHVAMTVDGTADMPIARAYLDGALQFSSLTSEMDLDVDPTNNPGQLLDFFLDNTAGGGTGEWSPGRVAVIRVWDGVLTDVQAAALAARPFAGN